MHVYGTDSKRYPGVGWQIAHGHPQPTALGCFAFGIIYTIFVSIQASLHPGLRPIKPPGYDIVFLVERVHRVSRAEGHNHLVAALRPDLWIPGRPTGRRQASPEYPLTTVDKESVERPLNRELQHTTHASPKECSQLAQHPELADDTEGQQPNDCTKDH